MELYTNNYYYIALPWSSVIRPHLSLRRQTFSFVFFTVFVIVDHLNSCQNLEYYMIVQSYIYIMYNLRLNNNKLGNLVTYIIIF